MIVCVCNRVNSAQIREAVKDGATDVYDVSEKLGLGTSCGRCVEFAEKMISDEARALGYEVTVA